MDGAVIITYIIIYHHCWYQLLMLIPHISSAITNLTCLPPSTLKNVGKRAMILGRNRPMSCMKTENL